MNDIKNLEQREVSMLNFEVSPGQTKHEWIPSKRVKNPVYYSQSRKRQTNIFKNIKKLKLNLNELKEDEHGVLKGNTDWSNNNNNQLASFSSSSSSKNYTFKF